LKDQFGARVGYWAYFGHDFPWVLAVLQKFYWLILKLDINAKLNTEIFE
jgi:hypothetical protein